MELETERKRGREGGKSEREIGRERVRRRIRNGEKERLRERGKRERDI